jgi:hypothetical protein
MSSKRISQACLAGLCFVVLLGMTAFQAVPSPKFVTPVDAAWNGTTSRGYPMSFTVSSGGAQWSTFILKTDFVATTCYNASGTIEITVPGPGSITSNQFSYTSSTFSFTGQFNSASTASGTYSFTNRQIVIGIPNPPYVCYYYLTQSGTWTASTPLPPPGDFGKVSPANGAVNQSVNPILTWNPSTYADSYQYCIDEVDNGDCDTSWEPNPATGNTSIAVSGLASNTTYYWQVRSTNSTDTTLADGNVWWSFTTRPQLTVYSVGTQDGWILESTETSNAGGTLDAASTTFNVGDGTADKQYRSILSFNTNSLPDTAVITKVTLKIRVYGTLVGNNNPFTWGQGLKVDVCKGTFGTSALQLTDFNFNDATNCKLLAGTFGSTPTSGWYSVNLTSAGRAKVNLTGLTQFRLRFYKDDNDDGAADYWRFYSGNSTNASLRPTLIIEYYVP